MRALFTNLPFNQHYLCFNTACVTVYAATRFTVKFWTRNKCEVGKQIDRNTSLFAVITYRIFNLYNYKTNPGSNTGGIRRLFAVFNVNFGAQNRQQKTWKIQCFCLA